MLCSSSWRIAEDTDDRDVQLYPGLCCDNTSTCHSESLDISKIVFLMVSNVHFCFLV